MKTPDTEKCEHKVVKKYCFRCKRPDLAGNVKNTPDTAHAVYQSTEADKCPKCGEDHRLISRCKTPDTEMEKMIIYDHHIARINHDKKGNIESIVVDIPPVLKDLLTSRDTYWKERVRKEINEISRHWIEEATRNPDNFEVRIKLDALDTLLDNLK